MRRPTLVATPRTRAAAAAGVLLLLAGCVTTAPLQAPPQPPPTGLADLLDRPAERALHEALRAYDDGLYAAAENAARDALANGLRSRRDQALAHKLLAFITCTSERLPECEAAFRAARSSDPAFALNRAESGHPLWGPVYQRVIAP